MTAPAARPAAGARAGRPRPARRALDQLSLTLDEAVLEAIAAPTRRPGWPPIGAPPSSAWATLPGETNQLYTPYIDLRAAQLDGRRGRAPTRQRRNERRARRPPTAPTA